MEDDRWQRIQFLFDNASRLDSLERETYLVEACADNPSLQDEVRALLGAAPGADRLLDQIRSSAPLPGWLPFRPGETLQHYELGEVLGSGGMGVVYRGRDRRLGRQVALKFLPPHFSRDEAAKRRFMNEARAASVLDHDGICTIYDIGETDDGQIFISMALYEGQDLGEHLENGPLALEQALAVGAQALEGLAAAHARGIVHRDIKPANVFLTREGRVKILDFGVAKLPDAKLTATGNRLGTIAYMAPELLQGEAALPASDCWSAGVLLYEMLTGVPPFQAEQPVQLMQAILNDALLPLRHHSPQIPETVEALLARALTRDPDRRFRDAAEFLEALRALDGGLADGTPARDIARAASARRAGASDSTVSERRQVTALCCRLSSSIPMDPEWWGEIEQAFWLSCTEIVAGLEGELTLSPTGDLIALFGVPLAHEDAAARAVRAGLVMIDAAGAGADPSGGEARIMARAGIHTAMVVVRERDHTRGDTGLGAGQAVRVAERLLGTVPAGGVVVSGVTLQLVRRLFTTEPLDSLELEDTHTRVDVHRVLGERAGRTGQLSMRMGRSAPLVGRDHELGLLRQLWEHAREGRGRCLLISGEAGIGKSRLAQAFADGVASDEHTWLVDAYCSPYRRQSALYPIVEMLEQVVLKFTARDEEAQRIGKLENLLRDAGLDLQRALPLLADLLGLTPPPAYPPVSLAPERLRQLTHEALFELLVARTDRQALLFIIEDVHWADPSTLEFVERLVAQAPACRLLLVATCRNESIPSWAGQAQVMHLALTRLTRGPVERMIALTAGERSLPAGLVEQLVTRTDGVPLFVEELTKMVLESRDTASGTGSTRNVVEGLPDAVIPATLQDSLAARLDHLGRAKAVAQIGSALGREFSAELIERLWQGTPAELRAGLDALVEAGLVYRRGSGVRSLYIFKHALIQDAAYASLLHRARRELHARIADALEKAFPAVAQGQPELLAYHLTEAGLPARAVPYWSRAAESAVAHSANTEAIAHAERGLESLNSFPEGPERLMAELGLQMNLGLALMATRGYAADEVARAYGRAREVCEQLGDSPQLFPVLFGLWTYHCVRADHAEALALGHTLLGLAEQADDAGFRVEANMATGISAYYMGQFESARDYFAAGLQCYDAERHADHAVRFGQDPAMVILSYEAWNEWRLGEPEQALLKSAVAMETARRSGHPHTLAYALTFAAWHEVNLGRFDEAAVYNDEALAVCQEHALGMFLALASVLSAWILLKQGHTREGIEGMQGALEVFTGAGVRLFVPFFKAELARALAAEGGIQAARAVLTEAEQEARERREEWCEPTLGEVRSQLPAD